jgi:hypothetical protein
MPVKSSSRPSAHLAGLRTRRKASREFKKSSKYETDRLGTTSDTLSNNANKNTENLDKGVEKMFKKFPPGFSK